jgi:CTP synthase
MTESATRYIFITGGVVSSLGKGLAMASLGSLLESRGLRVKLRKLDPYLNVDPGTMNPIQHGECFVTDDGAETDLDLGHYERFTSVRTRRQDSVTSGQIYAKVLMQERRGDYLGKTVQVVPHVTGEIKNCIMEDEGEVDVVLCELGGTVGDIEGLPFLEATRQLRNELGRERTMFIHTTLVPYIAAAGELKTKPTQHSVRELLSLGIQADMLLCRVGEGWERSLREKISLFCNVPEARVIGARDVGTIYGAPMMYHEAGVDREVVNFFGLETEPPNMRRWSEVMSRIENPEGSVKVCIVGKYTELQDAYKSLDEALSHGGIAHKVKVEKVWLDSGLVSQGMSDDEIWDLLEGSQGVVIPGGFGASGIEGKIRMACYARERKVPFFGICLGMQVAVVDYARRCAGLERANSSEFGGGEFDAVVALMEEWMDGGCMQERDGSEDKGGTMRLGSYACDLLEGSRVRKIYNKDRISERHRHRYEVNGLYMDLLSRRGMIFSGKSPDGRLAEIVEIEDHPWFLGVQFHPELRSRPFSPHPLFADFIGTLKDGERLL